MLGSEEVFTDRRKEAAHAAELVNRIRQDESVHVAWLLSAISEFRSFTIKTISGEEVNGAEILDPIWDRMEHWHAVEMHETNRTINAELIKKTILATENGEAIFKQFEALTAA